MSRDLRPLQDPERFGKGPYLRPGPDLVRVGIRGFLGSLLGGAILGFVITADGGTLNFDRLPPVVANVLRWGVAHFGAQATMIALCMFLFGFVLFPILFYRLWKSGAFEYEAKKS